ncbi:MAG: septation protein IspZ [Pseudomonadota bacterium]|jgi:intracellular septation protein A|nr:septation protein IspZ [Pseudomonadota bacterium]
MAEKQGGLTLWRYRRRFAVDGVPGCVTLRSRTDGLFSEFELDGRIVARDQTPAIGPSAVRNHLLTSTLPDGSPLTIEAGYISSLNMGIAVRRDDVTVHESHPGRTIAYPEKYRAQMVAYADGSMGDAFKQSASGDANSEIDFSAFKRNRIPLAVDILLGLLFFVIAKYTDLTTAAIVGAGLGLALLVAQKITKIDLLGGLALFGIALMIASAALALMFQSDEAVKYRTTVIGLVSAGLFLIDGLRGGNGLAIRLKNYLPYRGIDAGRLGIGMGLMGAAMAALNLIVALYTSTDVWLFYSTFADFVVSMALILIVFQYAQGKIWRETWPRYRPPPADEAG